MTIAIIPLFAGICAKFASEVGRMEDATTTRTNLGLLPLLFFFASAGHIVGGMVKKIMAKVIPWPVRVFVDKPRVAGPTSL